jgi:hypothetical protein
MEYPKELIQNLPVAMLVPWCNASPSPNNDLELMTDIMENGITTPIEIGIGIWSRKVRLNTGNHRIYLAPRLGISHLPVICRVWNYCAFDNHNGDHSYDTPHITKKQEWITDEYFEKPSEALDIMQLLMNI